MVFETNFYLYKVSFVYYYYLQVALCDSAAIDWRYELL